MERTHEIKGAARPKVAGNALRLKRAQVALYSVERMRKESRPGRRGKSVYADAERHPGSFMIASHSGCDIKAGFCDACEKKRKHMSMPRDRVVNVTGSGWPGMRGSADIIAEGIAHGIVESWSSVLESASRYVKQRVEELS
jgi:hypothetical protein